jgi:hypothetical protein
MQQLVLESSKPKRRIIVIHDQGEILKFIHSDRLSIVKSVDRVENAQQVAEKVYKDNSAITDFVVVLERKSVEIYFAKVQDSWKVTEDLDVYVHRMFASLDDYPEGIATYPGTARSNLGLQWRLGSSYETVIESVQKYVPADSTVFFGVFKGDTLWASLVLGFDADKKINNITTADPTELSLTGDWKAQSSELVSWVNKKFPKCSIGIFTNLEDARKILKSQAKIVSILDISKKGNLLIEPVPAILKGILA